MSGEGIHEEDTAQTCLRMLPDQFKNHLIWNSARFPRYEDMEREVRQKIGELGQGYNPSINIVHAEPQIDDGYDDADLANIDTEEADDEELFAMVRRLD